MKLSLIIPIYNAAATLGEQLDAIAAVQWPGEWELILADNGSTDTSMSVARSYEGRIANLRIVDASDHQGAGYARNKGAEVATGETLAFVDADDVIAPGWVAAMAKASETHDFLASRFDYIKLCDQAEQDYCGGTQVNGIQHMWWPPFYPHSGSCGLVVKKTLHDAVGGFDNDWVELQDTDYCIRLYRHGARLRFAPDALMHIRNRSTYKGIFRQAKLWGQYNVLLYKRYRLEDNKLPHPTRRFCRDAYKALKRYIRGPVNSGVIYQLGWHVGLLKGSLMYRVAPPVVGLVA
ncbi:MAG: glycosyltransferase family 2 protein, partial [Phycisphaeraceae bacterium]